MTQRAEPVLVEGDAPAKRGLNLNLSSRDLLLVVLLITALAGLAWFYLLYKPTRSSIQNLTTENQTLQSEIALGRKAKANLPALRKQVKDLTSKRDVFFAKLPKQAEVAQLLNQIRLAASNADVQFSSLNTSSSSSGAAVTTGVQMMPFSMTTQGTYAKTISFLRALENLPRFTRIKDIALTVDAEGSADPLIISTYDFEIFVYSGIPQPTNAASTAETTEVSQ